jgi:hypothetical protein
MANLTSSLTLKLTDLLSGPAGEAATALKKFGLSAQDLQKATKLDQLKVVQADFQKVSLAVTNTSQTVKVLTERLAAAKNPTAQMQTALERAQKASTAAGQSFTQQSNALKQSYASLQSLGVPLSQIATEETRLKEAALAATQAMEQQAARAQSVGARIRRGIGNAFGSIAPYLGAAIGGATHEALKAAGEIDSSETGLRAAGISASEIESITKIVMAQQARFPQLPINELLDRYKEERSITKSPEEAQQMLPVIAQTMAVLKTMGDGSTKDMGFMLKASQVLGAAQNPARLTSFMDAFLKAKQVKGDLISPEQMYSFMAGIKGSGALLSDRFLHTTAMSLAAELKGGRAGSGIDAMVKAITAPSGEEAKEFFQLGLMNRGDFKPAGGGGGFKSFGRGDPGKLGEVKFGAHVAGWQLAQTDPDTWVKQYLMPALRQHGFTDMPAALALVEKMFPGRSSDVVTKLITQAKEYEAEAEKFRESHGFEAAADYLKDAKFQLETLGTTLWNFGGTLMKPGLVSSATTMNAITRSIAGLSEWISNWQSKHPDIAPWASKIGAGAGLAAGSYGLITLARSLIGGFGLKSSAAALDVAAGNLSAAALKLGGGSVAAGAAAKTAGGAGLLGAVAPLAVAAGAAYAGTHLSPAEQKIQDEMQRRQNAGEPEPVHGPFNSWAEIKRRLREEMPGGGGIGSLKGGGASGSWSGEPPAPTEGYRIPLPRLRPEELGAAPISPPSIDSHELGARAAGASFGSAFRQGAMEELNNAVADARLAMDKIIAMMTFGASPNITPSAAGGKAGASGGLSANGIFSDPGVAPLR